MGFKKKIFICLYTEHNQLFAMNYISICFEVANDWFGLPLYFVGRSVGWYKKKTNLDTKKSSMNSRKVYLFLSKMNKYLLKL